MTTGPITNIGGAAPIGYVPQTAPNGAEIAGGLANAALSVAGVFAGGGIGGALGGAGDAAMYAQLMQEQNRIQRETQIFTAQSNASKAKHDTQMNTIRNLKS
jgi:hypothetical protein